MTPEAQARAWMSEHADAVKHCCDHGLSFNFETANGPIIGCCFCSFATIFTNKDDVTSRHTQHAIENICIFVLYSIGLEKYQEICTYFGRNCEVKEIDTRLIEQMAANTGERALQEFETKHHVPFCFPLTPEMGSESTRFRSLLRINRMYLQRLNIPALYRAGYYYADRQDSIRCYYCATKIRNWKAYCCRDDMFLEHALENPACLHLLLTKGLPFVESIRKERNSHKSKSVFNEDPVKKKLRDTPIQAKSDT